MPKTCQTCQRTKPTDLDHFFKRRDGDWSRSCKECLSNPLILEALGHKLWTEKESRPYKDIRREQLQTALDTHGPKCAECIEIVSIDSKDVVINKDGQLAHRKHFTDRWLASLGRKQKPTREPKESSLQSMLRRVTIDAKAARKKD